jgi:hypothetical protein
MFADLEYHLEMRSRFFSALFPVFVLVVLSSAGVAQGPPASLTSQGFGGNFSRNPGVPASVTSPGFGNNTPNHNQKFFFTHPPFRNPHFGNGVHRGSHRFQNFFGAAPLYAVPYYVPYDVSEPVDDTMEQMQAQPQSQYLGGPTIFDRRGPGVPYRDTYADRAPAKEQPEPAPATQSGQAPPADQPETLLVFKDGHKLGVQNYAILGDTLYDMTPGHSRKVVIADLDLDATVKENDQRGIDFRLPLRTKAN